MQYINYLNSPLRTLSAREIERLELEAAVAAYKGHIEPAEELPFKPLPERRCPPARPRPVVHRKAALKTDDVLQIICLPVLAEVMGKGADTIRNWGVNVPKQHEEWLRGLVEHWHLLGVVRVRLLEGATTAAIAKELKTRTDRLACLCAEYGINDWPQFEE